MTPFRIYKFGFDRTGLCTIPFADPKILLVGYQGITEMPTLWAEVNTSREGRATFFMVGTGDQPSSDHVGSAVCGSFVWHVYRGET